MHRVGDRVRRRRAGYGVVCGDSVPPSRLYVRVLFDSGLETNVLIEELETETVKQKSDAEHKVGVFRSQEIFYRVAAMLLCSNVCIKISASADAHSHNRAVEWITSMALDYEVGETLLINNGSKVQYVNWWLCAKDNGWVELLHDYFPSAHDRKCGWGFLTSKVFVGHFLLGDLGFYLGSNHDVSRIISRVPPIFEKAFEEGLS